ncbi:MAG: GNAT family N-acetyltransferase [Gammaproteobacteria bacterium]|nr:GNAT family N-acetyltransferase [Gammaproteobacteria bacterium]
MTNKFTIRLASQSDVRLLVNFRIAILRELNILADDAEAKLMKLKFRNYISNKMKKKELFCWLTEHDEKIIGVGKAVIYDAPPQSITHGGKEGYIFGIYTIPEMRGKGLGTLMMKHIISELKKRGYNNIWLRASKDGKPIYEKLGFITSEKDCCEYMELRSES